MARPYSFEVIGVGEVAGASQSRRLPLAWYVRAGGQAVCAGRRAKARPYSFEVIGVGEVVGDSQSRPYSFEVIGVGEVAGDSQSRAYR